MVEWGASGRGKLRGEASFCTREGKGGGRAGEAARRQGSLSSSLAPLSQDPVLEEVRQTIVDGYTYSAENLKDKPNGYSADGSAEFWSSGGLRNLVPADAPGRSYESFNMVPKYISVIPLGEGYATALYYVEGSYQEVGGALVNHYFTRAMEVYVKENGEWKVRAAHWSPVVGGTGTEQTAIVR